MRNSLDLRVGLPRCAQALYEAAESVSPFLTSRTCSTGTLYPRRLVRWNLHIFAPRTRDGHQERTVESDKVERNRIFFSSFNFPCLPILAACGMWSQCAASLPKCRETERDRERQKETTGDREAERRRDRETERDRDGETELHRELERERDRDSEKHRDIDRDTDTDRVRNRDSMK